MNYKTKIIGTSFIAIFLGFGIGYFIFHSNSPKNKFADFTKEKQDEYLKSILGGEIDIKTARNQLTQFTDLRDTKKLDSTNMPLGVCFSSKEVVAFLIKTYNYPFDITQIPDDGKGIAFLFGISGVKDYRMGKGTVMLVSTEYGDYPPPSSGVDPNAGRVILNNKVVNFGSPLNTQAYDIGSIYP